MASRQLKTPCLALKSGTKTGDVKIIADLMERYETIQELEEKMSEDSTLQKHQHLRSRLKDSQKKTLN